MVSLCEKNDAQINQDKEFDNKVGMTDIDLVKEEQANGDKVSTTEVVVATNTASHQRDERSPRKYHIRVDPLQDDKAVEIKLFSFKRPHMRAFHFAWWCYHVAFLMWFSITPLLTEVQKTLNLTKQEIWASSICAVAGTVVMRFVLGPFCDRYGPRIPMGIILIAAGIPTALTGLVNSSMGLSAIRFFIGVGGSTFVMCQYWTTRMFTKELVGTANATVAGWGNLGGGVTQLLVGSFLFPLLTSAFNGDTSKAWRTACIFPATLGLITGVCVLKYADDAPRGNFAELRKTGADSAVAAAAQRGLTNSFREGVWDVNVWLLFVQYACCFGVEITMNNAAAWYFKEEFDMTTASAAAVASVFGWMNLFARGLGGFVSDKANAKQGMKGRLLWQTICLFVEGVLVIIFAHSSKLPYAILTLICFSIFVQAGEGSTYGVVPYVNPPVTGSVSGIVGAGGNVGAVVFGLCFQRLDSKLAFVVMGVTIIISSSFSFFVNIPGETRLALSSCCARQSGDNVKGVTNEDNVNELELKPVEMKLTDSAKTVPSDCDLSVDSDLMEDIEVGNDSVSNDNI